MSLTIQLWGVRGSLPAPHPPEILEKRLSGAIESFLSSGLRASEDIASFVRGLHPSLAGGYGGNTSCVEVSSQGQSLIIDAGSGLRRLGEKMMSGDCRMGKGEVHLFFTHFHWDHLIGLPFFIPIFIPGNKIHFYAVQPELEECVRALFRKPFFPVPFEDLRSHISFHRLEPRCSLQINGMQITPYQLDHPDPSWGYRVEAGGKAYAHCVDTEGTRVSPAQLGPDVLLYRDADLMLFDAQYTLLEAVEKMNWGHSAAPIGLDIALRENVKRVLFAHHDPGASDEKIADAERQTRDYIQAYRENAALAGLKVPDIEWGFARESQVVSLV